MTKEEIIDGCIVSVLAGADFVKTSTGFGFGGAQRDHVALMKFAVGPLVQVKASGGVRTQEDALVMLGVGASRIGKFFFLLLLTPCLLISHMNAQEQVLVLILRKVIRALLIIDLEVST